MKTSIRPAGFALALVLATSPALRAHCDTREGPVVIAAKNALAAKDVTPVLKWVGAADEPTVRMAFARAVAVREDAPSAAALADDYFFETLVRLHRAGEGAPYTGLKSTAPAGIEQASDTALESGAIEPLAKDLLARLRQTLDEKFATVSARQTHADHSVEAGRAFVAAYVDYVHFVEAISKLSERNTGGASAHAH